MIFSDIVDEDGNTQYVNILHIQRIYVEKDIVKEGQRHTTYTTIISFSDCSGTHWEMASQEKAIRLAERINARVNT